MIGKGVYFLIDKIKQCLDNFFMIDIVVFEWKDEDEEESNFKVIQIILKFVLFVDVVDFD